MRWDDGHNFPGMDIDWYYKKYSGSHTLGQIRSAILTPDLFNLTICWFLEVVLRHWGSPVILRTSITSTTHSISSMASSVLVTSWSACKYRMTQQWHRYTRRTSLTNVCKGLPIDSILKSKVKEKVNKVNGLNLGEWWHVCGSWSSGLH